MSLSVSFAKSIFSLLSAADKQLNRQSLISLSDFERLFFAFVSISIFFAKIKHLLTADSIFFVFFIFTKFPNHRLPSTWQVYPPAQQIFHIANLIVGIHIIYKLIQFFQKISTILFSTFRKVYNFVAFQQWNDIFEIGVYLRFVLTCRNFATF